MTAHSWQEAVGYGAVAIVLLAAFPRLAYRLQWRTDRRPRAVVAHLAFNTAIGFGLHTWVLPYLRRMAHLRAQAEEALRQQLGRQPTDEELLAHFGIGRTR
jgi:hypothetical protein